MSKVTIQNEAGFSLMPIVNSFCKCSIPDYEAVFNALESGKGWDAIKDSCTKDAAFTSQAGPLLSIKTLQGYAGFMQGANAAMPGCTFEIVSSAYDKKRNNAQITSVFKGTHSKEVKGFPPVTNKSTVSDYTYVMFFDEDQKIKKILKVWNAHYSAGELGWN
eukprot:jgi/Bigna1/91546/estExt_fgenesh1_pg.C_1050031